jgi:hypothetical protein
MAASDLSQTEESSVTFTCAAITASVVPRQVRRVAILNPSYYTQMLDP